LPFLYHPLVPNAENELILGKSNESTLCTLVSIQNIDPSVTDEIITNNSPGSDYIVTPVARSYSNNDWENVPGRFMKKFQVTTCEVERCITKLEQETGKYYLVSSNHTLASFDEELSRFFMQTTFGPTRNMINNWEYDESLGGLANWIKDQVSLPATKHREYLRKHAEIMTVNNTIADTAASVQHPCEPYSRWRKYAFISSDSYRDFDVVAYGNQFMILMDGKPRTIVDSFSNNDGTITGTGSYKFCTYQYLYMFEIISPVFVSNIMCYIL
jgi:hypothetical protein